MTWPTGQDVIERLLGEGHLQQVPAGEHEATELLAVAGRHLEAARRLADFDPNGAYTLAYDAARKSLTALLQTQGLRPTSRGGHIAVQQAISAQFTSPPPSVAFRPFSRLRSERNAVEYAPVSSIVKDDVLDAVRVVERMYDVADKLLRSGSLTVFQPRR